MNYQELSAKKAELERQAAELEKQIKEAEQTSAGRMLRLVVTAEHVAGIVSRWTGIPVDKMLEGERHKLLAMEQNLRFAIREGGHTIGAGVITKIIA